MKQRRSSASDLIQVLLTDKELQRIESAFRSVARDTIARLEKTVPAALDGQTQAVSRYVAASRRMIDWLLGGVNSRYPDCVGREEGEFVILDKARRVMGLNDTELGRLFGTSRQAVAEWAHEGVPVARESKLWMVLSIAELHERKLKPGVVPAIVRQKAETYDGLTILEMIQNDRHNEVLEKTRASFEWAATA